MADGWLKTKAPALHRFLTRRDRPWPVVREVLVGALVIGILLGGLYGLTAQPIHGGYPVVVVTTGSMMHCDNYPNSQLGSTCTPSHWGRLGTIDPGDLVFVRHVSDPADVTTKADAGASHYGRPGDVIVYRKAGLAQETPIIHRALFWVQVNQDRTFSVPALGLDHAASLNVPAVRAMLSDAGGCDVTSTFQVSSNMYGEAGSGFVTRGDNNNLADQCAGIPPARLEWVLGKARGEVPWIGLVNLLWGDITGGTSHYGEAGNDSKVMFFVTVAVLVSAPWLIELVMRRRQRARAEKLEKEEPED
ncbi:MAG: S26 family signal peptidase [Thermoplasmatota archaeon]|nr:S26 family signal peptidase [Halobacteriales archaeon]